MTANKPHFLAIEAGGTKFVLAHGSGPNDLQQRETIATTSPDETMTAVIDYITQIHQQQPILAIGAGVFGPLDLKPESDTYGYITTTVKSGWNHFDFVGALKSHFKLPVGFDTDVNVAAIGEHIHGAGHGLTDMLYVTIGTGIGAGFVGNNKLLHGAMHPEMGHMLIAHDQNDDPFEGVCHFHGNCLEGLASGTAIKQRWQMDSLSELPPDHPAWKLQAHYLGMAMANFSCCFSPQRIILGGGVMRQQHLLAKIRANTLKKINGYLKHSVLTDMDSYIVKPLLDENAGIVGAIELAKTALNEEIK